MEGQVIDHLDHCLNAVREIIMCQADVTPVVWRTSTPRHSSSSNLHHHGHSGRHAGDEGEVMEMSPPRMKAKGNWESSLAGGESIAQYNTIHTCRSYSDIQDWAAKHAMPRPISPDRFNESLPHHSKPSRQQLLDSGLLVGIEF